MSLGNKRKNRLQVQRRQYIHVVLVWAVIAASMASTVGVGVWPVGLSVAESVNVSQRGQAQGEGKDEEREAAASRGQIYIWYYKSTRTTPGISFYNFITSYNQQVSRSRSRK